MRWLRVAWCVAVLGCVAAVGCAGTTRRGFDQATVSLRLMNRTSETVCFLFVSPRDQDAWSDDVLGSASIDPGRAQLVRLPPGLWDLRTENCQHEATGVLRGARITQNTTLMLQ